MITTAFLSMWISNVATTAMMIPIAQAVLDELFLDQVCFCFVLCFNKLMTFTSDQIFCIISTVSLMFNVIWTPISQALHSLSDTNFTNRSH